jgi:putative DNA primase/helicase
VLIGSAASSPTWTEHDCTWRRIEKSRESRAHALEMFLLPFAREFINGSTPLHGVDKPQPGTGGGLLVETVILAATGRSPAFMTEAVDEDEWRKRITSKLSEAPMFIVIDNVVRPLKSPHLASALTVPVWEDRELGRSRHVHYPVRAEWIAIKNNLICSGEIVRRVVRIRLDAKRERPWQRKGFRHADLREWVVQNRGELIWAGLVLVKAWLAAGRP